jgi:hypothetical protein
MAQQKTKPTHLDVFNFIDSFSNTEQKRLDSLELVALMQKISGFEPKMWGPSIIGFGQYHYKYASGHEGDAPLIGFSPRKSAISLYVYTGLEEHEHLLMNLGKFKKGKSCIYINKLSDIDTHELTSLIKKTMEYLKTEYEEL